MNLKIDGISTSQVTDSSGELLMIAHHDISDLEEGRGVLNWEHSNKAEDIIGSIIYAKKILERKDCENDRQRMYYDTVKNPIVYIIGEIWEDEEHAGACAVAAMIRYYHKKGEKLLTSFSVEGATLERDGNILKESIGRRVAITLKPCNHSAIAGLLEDPKIKKIAKSIEAMSQNIDNLFEVDSVILDDAFMPNDPLLDLHKSIESLNKTLTAGMGNVAPSQLTGGAALAREHISGFDRNRIKAAVRDWNRKRPLKEVIKASLPEVSDDYIQHFTDLAEELALKKSTTNKLIRIGSEHSRNPTQNDAQKQLLEGMYVDPKVGGKAFNPGHSNFSNALHKLKNDAGQDVLMKNPAKDGFSPESLENAQNASHYYHLASENFGMGKHVPVTNYFFHKDLATQANQSGIHHQAMEIIPKSKTPLTNDAAWKKAQKTASDDGSLHKLMMMDHILGNSDRHLGNLLLHPSGHVMSIDNDNAFGHQYNLNQPEYITDHSVPLHPEAAKWIKGIDAKKLAGTMLGQGHEPTTIKTAITGLKQYQKLADKPMNADHIWRNVQDNMTSVAHEARVRKMNENLSNKIR